LEIISRATEFQYSRRLDLYSESNQSEYEKALLTLHRHVRCSSKTAETLGHLDSAVQRSVYKMSTRFH